MKNTFKILVIDDDALLRMTLTAYLEDSGYSVIEAEDGRKGVELFATEHPHVVVTDLRMPEMDGFAVIARLKEDSPGTPIIVITGTGDKTNAEQAVEMGAYDALFKPINDMARLEAVIIRALDPS